MEKKEFILFHDKKQRLSRCTIIKYLKMLLFPSVNDEAFSKSTSIELVIGCKNPGYTSCTP